MSEKVGRSSDAVYAACRAADVRRLPVRELTETELVVELRRLRAVLADESAECEFADITNERARRELCRMDGCGCIDAAKRETEIAKRLMKRATR